MGCGSAKSVDVEETEQICSSKTHSKTHSKTPSQIQGDQFDLAKIYRRANHLIKNEQYTQATRLLDIIIENNPNFIDAYYSKGIIELDQLKLDAAKKYFKITLEKSPNHPLALNELASLMIKDQDYKEALVYLEKGFQANPNIPDLNYGLGYVLSKLKRKEEAIQYFDLAIKEDSSQKHYYVSKATALSDLKQYDQALEVASNALKIDSEYIDGFQAQAYIYSSSKQYDKLEEVCEKVLKIDDQNQFILNCRDKIQKNLQKQPSIPQVQLTVEDKLNEIQKLKSEQQYSQALNLINLILDQNPAQIQALKLKAEIQIEQRQQTSSLITLNQILSIKSNDIDTLNKKVTILEYLGKYEEVLICYDSILAQENNFDLLEKKATTLIKLNRIQEASEIYEYLYTQSSQDDPKIFIIRGKLLQVQQKYDDAIICLNDGLIKFQENIEILNLLAQIYKHIQKEQLALEIYEKFLNIIPQNTQYLYEKGLILFKLNNFSESFEIFSYLNSKSFDKNLDYYLGICHNEKKEYIQALKYLTQYVKIGKENLEKIYFIMGSANLYLLNLDQAIDNYLNCIKINSNNSETYFFLGNVYKEKKLLEDAKNYYEQAVKIDPQNNIYKSALENLINEKAVLQEYQNSLLFTLITFIGCCQLDPKVNDYEKKQNQKYLTLLTLMETHLKIRFNTIEKHFEIIKELIAQSYDMRLTLIDDTLFPIMQFWHNQKICKKKKDNNDLVVSMINVAKSLINLNNQKILDIIQSDKSLNNRYCVEFQSKCHHEAYQKRSGNIGLLDGIKILGFLIKYYKEFNSETTKFPEFVANQYLIDEIQIFHDSYYHQEF